MSDYPNPYDLEAMHAPEDPRAYPVIQRLESQVAELRAENERLRLLVRSAGDDGLSTGRKED